MFLPMGDFAFAASAGEVNKAFFIIRTAGARETRDRNGDIGFGSSQSSLGHLTRNGLADRAATLDLVTGDAEKVAFGILGIDNEAAVEDVPSVGDVGEQGRQQAAGAAFRRRQ